MQAYSLDLRERVVSAYEKGANTIAEIATRFSVGQTFLKKMLRQKRDTGSLERLPQRAGAKKALSEPHRNWLAMQVRDTPRRNARRVARKVVARKESEGQSGNGLPRIERGTLAA